MFLFHLKNSLRSQDISIFVMTFPSCRKTAEPIKCQCCPHIETSQLICFANQLTAFSMRATLVLDGLIKKIRLIFREVQATRDNEKWSVNKIYNMRNIFLQKSFTKCDGEIVLRSFSKNSKLSVSLDL